MPVVRASNLAGQSEFVALDGSARWLGDWVGGHYQPALHRTAAGRWFAGFLTRDGYADLTGYPLRVEDDRTVYPSLVEVSADGAATWFQANRIAFPPELVAALSAPPAPPPAAGTGRTAEPTEGTNRAGSATLPGPLVAPDREAIVAEYLREHPYATSPATSKATGIPEGTLRKVDAWINRKKHRNTGKAVGTTDAMRRARPLSEAMVAVVPARTEDPAELAEAREAESLLDRLRDDPEYRGIVEREYLEVADPSDKADYFDTDDGDRLQTLIAWKLTLIP